MNERSLRFRSRSSSDVAPLATREEAYPERWDAVPHAYVRLLAAARLREVHAFAVRAVEGRHPAILREATGAELVGMLQAPYEPTIKLGIAELERRFDPRNPDWTLLDLLLRAPHDAARELGESWLRITAPLWTRDVGRMIAWLMSPQAGTRFIAAELSIAALSADGNTRIALAQQLFGLLRDGQVKDDVADGVVMVARAILLEDLTALFRLDDLLKWIEQSSIAFLPLAGDLLGRRSETISEIGVDRIGWLAQHEMGAVRAGAHQLIRKGHDYFRDDASMLLVLAESDWEDARIVAVEMLRATLRVDALDLDHLLGFLDSTYMEVQNLGQDLTQQRFASLPADKLVFRLVQHPDPNMRHFALNLATQHLPDGAEPLARLGTFFRAALLDLWPDRLLKNRVLAFVAERGMRDEQQAAVAVRILSDVVRMQGRTDFERALESMARIKLAYPALASPLRILKESAQ